MSVYGRPAPTAGRRAGLPPHGGYIGGMFSYPEFQLLQESGSVFSSVFGYQGADRLNLSFRGQADLASTEWVSGDYFRGLGAQPAAGRLLGPDDDCAGAPPFAVISHALSERRFGGPDSAVGQSILINNLPFTVAGVTQRRFFGADPKQPPDIYVPVHARLAPKGARQFNPDDDCDDPNYDWVVIMARLRPGASAAQPQAVLAPGHFTNGAARRSRI